MRILAIDSERETGIAFEQALAEANHSIAQ
jgi:hypothetical protein